jgi:hypothetical protein
VSLPRDLSIEEVALRYQVALSFELASLQHTMAMGDWMLA